VSRPAGTLVLGVDFTSAPCVRKPITAAVGRLSRVRGTPVYRLGEVRGLVTLEDFSTFLVDEALGVDGWIGGFDLPFGQPRPLIEHERWPTDWPVFVRLYCGLPRVRLRGVFKRWCDARPAGDKFAWRRADRPAGSSPAMRWTNPPVAWMMHAGIGRMLAAGLVFPAHRHPPSRRTRAARIALEAYPAFTARRVVSGSYKSDTPAKQTRDRAANRAAILAALECGAAGLDPVLSLSAAWRRRIVGDGAGDLLDAVICALQAAHAAARPRFGLPRDLDPLEGWIAAVPAG